MSPLSLLCLRGYLIKRGGYSLFLHFSFVKEFEGINDSATELLKEKRTKIQESVVEEKGTPTIQVKLEGNAIFYSSPFIYWISSNS